MKSVAEHIIKNITDYDFKKNVVFKSKITKFDGKIVECDSFPSPIGTICHLSCNDEKYVTGEIIGFREGKNLIAVHDINANLVSGSSIEARKTSTNIMVDENILGILA